VDDMECNDRLAASGRQPGDSKTPTEETTKRNPPRDGHLFAVQKPKVVVIKGITVRGALKDMQIAYRTPTQRGTNDTCAVKRWRRVLRDSPDKFMKCLDWAMKRWKAEKEENRQFREEYEARGKRIADLEAENATLKSNNRRL
jgi:hypothetical protein